MKYFDLSDNVYVWSINLKNICIIYINILYKTNSANKIVFFKCLRQCVWYNIVFRLRRRCRIVRQEGVKILTFSQSVITCALPDKVRRLLRRTDKRIRCTSNRYCNWPCRRLPRHCRHHRHHGRGHHRRCRTNRGLDATVLWAQKLKH